MKITFLGTGTSQGVPVIACDCEVCQSNDLHDKRLRSSIMLEIDNNNFVIDTGPDFRQQMLRENVKKVDAILFTHEHKDHIAGLDDIRSFNWIYKKPMDIEWAKDGSDGKLYIVQARPETIYKEKTSRVLEQYSLGERGEAILTGKAIGSKIGKGWVKILDNVREIDKFNGGEVLVTKMTDPDWVPIMKKASAIITESGGRTCHAAIVSRELGIPCVIGAVGARNVLKDGQGVTVSCAEGEEGKVYRGFIPVKIQKINLEKIKKPKTKIMMNVGEPEQAFSRMELVWSAKNLLFPIILKYILWLFWRSEEIYPKEHARKWMN